MLSNFRYTKSWKKMYTWLLFLHWLIFNQDKFVNLKKALYGLKQANNEWFTKLSFFFTFVEYTQSMNDHSLFINSSEWSFTTLLVYVDDIIFAKNVKEKIDRVKETLNKTFNIKDLGDLRYFLGLEVARSKKGILMNQRKCAW